MGVPWGLGETIATSFRVPGALYAAQCRPAEALTRDKRASCTLLVSTTSQVWGDPESENKIW